MNLLSRLFGKGRKAQPAVTTDDAKSMILSLPEHQRMTVLSEMVASATMGKKSIHGKPYSVNPREKNTAGLGV